HFGSIVDAQWLPDGRLVTEDELPKLRVIKDGLVEQTLDLPVMSGGMLAVTPDLQTVALGGQNAIQVWRTGGIGEIPRPRVDDPVVRLELRSDAVVAFSRKGGVVRAYSTPASGAHKAGSWVAIDPLDQKREAALWRIANGENPKIADDHMTKAARVFAAWQS